MTSVDLASLNLLAHLAATLYMAGLIWFVQRVHYPLFAGVGRQAFPAYAGEHVARTSQVVGPPMIVEAVTALGLVWSPPPGVAPELTWLGGGLLVLIWASTALLQVPRHRDLADGFATRAHRRLVSTNWIRTAGWSARAVVVLCMVAGTLSGAS